MQTALDYSERTLGLLTRLRETQLGSIDRAASVCTDSITAGGLDWCTGPASTVTGAMIVNMIRCETAERLMRSGHQPVMLPSRQLVADADAQEQLDRFCDACRRSLRHLYG